MITTDFNSRRQEMIKTDTRLIIKFIDNTKKTYECVTDIDIVQPWIDGGYLRFYQGMEKAIIPLKTIKDYKEE